MTVTHGSLTVDWLGGAAVRLAAGERVVYVDPGSGETGGNGDGASETADAGPRDGDAVFVTHSHHYLPERIAQVAGADATLVVPEGLDIHRTRRTDTRPADLPVAVRRVGLAAEGVVAGVPFFAVAAYNRDDADGAPVHPRGRGCGYLLSVGGGVFHPGDTDALEGHAELDVAVLLAPIGGEGTMAPREAVDLAAAMEPELVVPVRYGRETDPAAFAEEVREAGIRVAVDRGD
jgi:L-ascorbate metabolism protein UlaG (beta-lactamase superfamily)